MKKHFIIILSLIFTAIILCSCSNSVSDKKADASENNTSTSEVLKNTTAKTVENAVTSNQKMANKDLENCEKFCDAFLKEHYAFMHGGKDVISEDFKNSKYFSRFLNDNLAQYSLKKINVGRMKEADKIRKLNNTVISSKINGNSIFIEIASEIEFGENSGEGETHQFLLKKSTDEKFVICDWYSEANTLSSIIDSSRKVDEKINNPDIWKDENFVNAMLDNANSFDKKN